MKSGYKSFREKVAEYKSFFLNKHPLKKLIQINKKKKLSYRNRSVLDVLVKGSGAIIARMTSRKCNVLK